MSKELNELNNTEEILEEITKEYDLMRYHHQQFTRDGKKIGAKRARANSNNLTKLMKLYRAASNKEEKE